MREERVAVGRQQLEGMINSPDTSVSPLSTGTDRRQDACED